MPDTGLMTGIALAVYAAARWRLIPASRRLRTAIGGTIGFAAAAILASQPDWQSPVGPALSGVLVPLIAVLGSTGGPTDQGPGTDQERRPKHQGPHGIDPL